MLLPGFVAKFALVAWNTWKSSVLCKSDSNVKKKICLAD